MAVTITYGGLSLNDGTNYVLLDGMDLGEPVKTWSEYRSYGGSVAQYNVTEANLIEVTIPLRVKGASLSGLKTNIDAINAKIDAGAQTLAVNPGTGSVNYSCVHSQRLNVPYDLSRLVAFTVDVVLTLMRTP